MKNVKLFLEMKRAEYFKKMLRLLGCYNHSFHVENIYHCCVQKTASQWFKNVFRDPVFFRLTGLEVIPFNPQALIEDPGGGNRLMQQFPERTLAAHLYVSYDTYRGMDKPETYRTFYVLRDPRDIVVSWYYSTKYSHALLSERMHKRRERLHDLSLEDGIKCSIDVLYTSGLFDKQRSWATAQLNESERIFHYEDFCDDNEAFLWNLFYFLEIDCPKKQFSMLIGRHKFGRYSGNRERGTADASSHYRKGVSGDWKNHFDEKILDYFCDVTGNLLTDLGYEV
jgi:hypothetical protein